MNTKRQPVISAQTAARIADAFEARGASPYGSHYLKGGKGGGHVASWHE